MVTFLSERLQHKQRKTLKVLIAADSETDLCAVSTPSLYNKVMMLWKIQEWISEDHDTRWKYAIPNLADQSSSQLLTQTLMFCLSTAGTNQSANQLYRYGKHSSQKMEPTTKTRAGTSPESCWLWGEILSLKVNHPVMWATTLRQASGHPSYQRLLYRRQRTPCSGPGEHSSMTHSDLALQIMSYTLSLELWSCESQTSRYTAENYIQFCKLSSFYYDSVFNFVLSACVVSCGELHVWYVLQGTLVVHGCPLRGLPHTTCWGWKVQNSEENHTTSGSANRQFSYKKEGMTLNIWQNFFHIARIFLYSKHSLCEDTPDQILRNSHNWCQGYIPSNVATFT